MWKPEPDKYPVFSFKSTQAEDLVTITMDVGGFVDSDEPQMWIVQHLNDTPPAHFQEENPKIKKAEDMWTISATFKLHQVDHNKTYIAVVGVMDETGERGEGNGTQMFAVS